MMNKPRPSTADSVEEKMGDSNYSEDCFSKFSDDILIRIISRSTMKDAATTSVLSHRWEKLWTFTSGSLEFYASSSFVDLRRSSNKKSLDYERFRFNNWVDQVLRSHKNSYVDELIVRFDLDITFTDSIDTWVQFAIQKGVQRLELDLSPDSLYAWPYCLNTTQLAYSIPYQKLLLWFNFFKNRLPSRPLDFTAAAAGGICLPLTSLTLKHVDVTGDVVEQFLRYSPLLKYLCISASKTLTDLRIAGPSLKLEHLEISQFCLDKLEISAPNLLSFTFVGNVLKPTSWSVPKLSTLSLGGYFTSTFMALNRRLYYNCLAQLEIIKLDRCEVYSCIPLCVNHGFPEYKNVKQLEVTVTTCWNGSLLLLKYPTLFKGFPSLQRLKIQFTWITSRSSNIRNTELIGVADVDNSYKCLKVVELNGFVGTWADTEVAYYFLQNAASLEKLIINPHMMLMASGGVYRNVVVEMEEYFEIARQRARLLKANIPHSAELVVL